MVKGLHEILGWGKGALQLLYVPSGKQPHNYGKSPLFMGKLTISMAIFNSYVKLPEGNHQQLMKGFDFSRFDFLIFYRMPFQPNMRSSFFQGK